MIVGWCRLPVLGVNDSSPIFRAQVNTAVDDDWPSNDGATSADADAAHDVDVSHTRS